MGGRERSEDLPGDDELRELIGEVQGLGPLEVAPAMVRLAAGVWLRTATWTFGSAIRAGRRVTHAVTSGESATELVEDAAGELRRSARRLLGINELADQLAEVLPPGAAPVSSNGDRPASEDPLRQRGAELLSRSADVAAEDGPHPAYGRILGSLAPDEGRILRLLALEGAQPAVDVRSWRPLGVGSELVAPGLSMIGGEAGCRYPDRVPMYLNNIFRLGLIWFSREPVDDLQRYQVLEAQPDVQEAFDEAGRARTTRRSIRLTPFGEDFCESCLPLHTAELEALDPDLHADSEALSAQGSRPPREDDGGRERGDRGGGSGERGDRGGGSRERGRSRPGPPAIRTS